MVTLTASSSTLTLIWPCVEHEYTGFIITDIGSQPQGLVSLNNFSHFVKYLVVYAFSDYVYNTTCQQ